MNKMAMGGMLGKNFEQDGHGGKVGEEWPTRLPWVDSWGGEVNKMTMGGKLGKSCGPAASLPAVPAQLTGV